MANTAEGTTQLLDQLQDEVNRVIEQMGRVFVATNENQKAPPVVPAAKLKQILPGSINSFHEALDQLERELQLAKLVMRRDLAVCRERSGLTKLPQASATATLSDVEKQQGDQKPTNSATNEPEAKSTADIAMQDVQPNQDAEMTDAPTESAAEAQDSNEVPKADSNTGEQTEVAATNQGATKDDSKTSDGALQINTNAQSKAAGETNQGEDENPPDTGTFTNDLDSLFGGPTSAGPGDGGEFNMDPNNNAEFDFGSFGANLDNNGADNDDNITSLLPDLQDYANNQTSPAHATDFDNIFDLNSVPMDGQHTQNDSTFDDLLDFEDFAAGDYGGTEGNNNTAGGNTDFDFSFD